MLKTELNIETVGKPDITALSENEQTSFFEALLANITELYEQNLSQQNG